MFRRGEGDEHPIQAREVREVRMAEGTGEVTVVGKGARLEGNIVSAGSLRIDGQVKGKITADGDVAISPNSQVEADIQAQNVVVGGAFKGNITARAKAELARGGRVQGNITAKSLIVAEGAIFSGQSNMGGEAPSGEDREPREDREDRTARQAGAPSGTAAATRPDAAAGAGRPTGADTSPSR
jgi:cytoskeletal protein CcmA (bactofilin family)